ncbi:carboxypeptidase-like regulatory domain-containing protein [Chitinophaga nivalis]|uniref:Carboxypeptidase-like regulatory domain-containing protein n=1 Tax=Chitinophaga nivalis TaxID=2991709 RepID=A0ABT3IFV0_9BACT|nr:carboxypeptidase-like regulatory domain-containing protein [Chitinophaga nivalis]MCW3467469.1 carboxypeptidase-like regulatory domain-containing protein [Chitinophaga nivalis]MCW3482839.1 carboxypeptidase-like regulatory domain-containing protein [Chitinophaga nivalis]
MNFLARVIALGSFFCLATVQLLQAQVTVTGMISDSNKLVLPYATVSNITNGKRSLSDQGGFYKISASRNDKLVFTFVGYHPDTLVVTLTTGTLTRNMVMVPAGKFLKGVEITTQYTPYQIDSIERRKQYGYILDLPDTHLAGDNTPVGAGVVFSPITRFSKKEKQKRQFKKNYEQMEREKYIDSRFTPVLVHQVTGLAGDSLQHFMRDNYPDYNLMRTIPNNDLIYWITDRYKAWSGKK